MSVDPKLAEIAKLAEADEPCPMLHLATAAHLIVGMPGPSNEFADAVQKTMTNELWARVADATPRKDRKATYEDLLDKLRPGWNRAMAAPEGSDPAVVTVFQALVWAWGEGCGLRLPAVRVRLDSVSTWWVGTGQQVKGAGGGGWFYGVSVPLGN